MSGEQKKLLFDKHLRAVKPVVVELLNNELVDTSRNKQTAISWRRVRDKEDFGFVLDPESLAMVDAIFICARAFLV
jgi:hypothetical protein